MTSIESILTKILKEFLVAKGLFCEEELQLTSKTIDLKNLVDQNQIRIDLCVYVPFDGSIIFVETEPSIYLKHPTIYKPFCNYLYLLIPEKSFTEQSNQEITQQLVWAKKEKIGVISINVSNKSIRLVLPSQRLAEIKPIIRSEIIRSLIERGVPLVVN